MVGIPTNFQAISNVLPTYDFVDIISGTGYINFYLGLGYGNSAYANMLSNYTYYSSAMATNGDNDFDVLLNRPMDIQGMGIVNIPVKPTNGSGHSVTVYIRKWDGVTETEIVSATSIDVIGSGLYFMLCVPLVIPLTHFKRGETLRVSIIGDNTAVNYGVDPKNRSVGWDTSGAVPSQSLFLCPVRLNL
jgi:hypothetical protein